VTGIAIETVNATETVNVNERDTVTIITRTMSVIASASAKVEVSHVATDETKFQGSLLSLTCEDVSQGSVLL
jgi:hypothetical protein